MELTSLINEIDRIVKNEPPDKAVSKILSLSPDKELLQLALSVLVVTYANRLKGGGGVWNSETFPLPQY